MRKFLCVMLLSLPLAACEESYEDQTADLHAYLSKNKIGYSRDYFLMKKNIFDQWEPVAVVYGFVDDLDFCSDVAELYMQRYTAAEYRCEAAN